VVEKRVAIWIECRIDILLGRARMVITGVKKIPFKGKSLILLGEGWNWRIALESILAFES
jgi:hypothetical protein